MPHTEISSFLFGQDHLVALAPSPVELFLGMSPLVLFAALHGLGLLFLDFACLLHNLGNMPVALDAPDFGLHKLLVDFHGYYD